jgi:putative component of toxin-antitoxin plasmid stabilization module
MRVHFGPCYRVYFSRRAEVVYLRLVGGDKSSQNLASLPHHPTAKNACATLCMLFGARGRLCQTAGHL